MIPRAYITAWRANAPWPDDDLVEQDLVISRALVEVLSHPLAAAELAFRGGTALHELVFDAPLRYSEDIDLVQVRAGPIGPIMRAIHDRLDGWLGEPSTRQGPSGVKLVYTFRAEAQPGSRRRSKLEIHTREHFTVQGIRGVPLSVSSPWFTAGAQIPTYSVEELAGTKLRALYQRKKGRDLFDLNRCLGLRELSRAQVVECFLRYTRSTPIGRAEFESNLSAKAVDDSFRDDMRPLLPPDIAWDVDAACRAVSDGLIALMPGAPWKGAGT